MARLRFFANPQQLNIDGDTALHSLVRNLNSSKEITQFVEMMGEEQSSIMAKTVNNKGEIPFDLVKKLNINQKEKTIINSMLLDLASKNNLKKLSESINLSDVIKQYEANGPLTAAQLANLEEACVITNLVRQIIVESTTHPQTTHSYEKNNQLQNLMDSLKMSTQQQEKQILYNNGQPYRITKLTYNGFEVELPKTVGYEFIANRVKPFEDNHLANCEWYSYIALKLLVLRNDYRLNGEIYGIENGDHVFLVIGRDPNSDPDKPETWGPKAVICDAWAGNIFLATEINTKLTTYRSLFLGVGADTKIYNIISSYNSNYHELGRWLSVYKSYFLPIARGDNNPPSQIEAYQAQTRKNLYAAFIFPRPEEQADVAVKNKEDEALNSKLKI